MGQPDAITEAFREGSRIYGQSGIPIPAMLEFLMTGGTDAAQAASVILSAIEGGKIRIGEDFRLFETRELEPA